MSEGLFALLKGYFGIPVSILIGFHSVLAQYFKSLIVKIISFPVEIPIWQS
jgi:hypothetical protein